MPSDLNAYTRSRLLVVLVNYNTADLIERRLASGSFGSAHVIIVDNGSQPAAVEAIGEAYGATTLLLPENRGFAGGVNTALEEVGASAYDAIALVNPDVDVRPGDLEELASTLADGTLDVAAPIVLDERGRPWVSTAGGPLTLRAVCWYFLGVSHLLPSLSGFFWTRRQVLTGTTLQPHWLCGAVLVIRGDAWTLAGPLRTTELVYAEDVEWGCRATARGARLGLVRNVTVVHSGGASGGSAAWTGATERLFASSLGPVRGVVAVRVFRTGLRARRLVRRWLRLELTS